MWTLAWVPEIQTISILADEASSEVFNISTSTSEDVLPEVQMLSVSYDDVDEVQTITTSQVKPNCFGSRLARSLSSDCRLGREQAVREAKSPGRPSELAHTQFGRGFAALVEFCNGPGCCVRFLVLKY